MTQHIFRSHLRTEIIDTVFTRSSPFWLHVPDQAWAVVTLDFVEGLPISASHDIILVIVDKFSRCAHLLALIHPFTALQVAKLYMHNIFKFHRIP